MENHTETDNANPRGGPRTEQGKQTASRNSTKHGAFAKSIDAFPPEDRRDYCEHRKRYMEYYQPEDPVEQDLINQMAFNRFRYYRLAGAEHAAIGDFGPGGDADLAVERLEKSLKIYDYFRRYITSLERDFVKLVREIEDRRKRHPPKVKPPTIFITNMDGTITYCSDPDFREHLKNAKTDPDSVPKYVLWDKYKEEIQARRPAA